MSICSIRFDPPESFCELTGDCRQYGGTLLMGAADRAEVESVQVLINSKASINLNNNVMQA